jgi:hypothetical protein
LQNFHKLGEVSIADLAAQLDAQPELWNAHRERTARENSPHQQIDDIWLRFGDPIHAVPGHQQEPHFARFYPAWHALPALPAIVFPIMFQCRAVYLGGVLITRIPPGGAVLPHHDRGTWHSEFHTCKVYVPVRANARCINRCEDEEVVMRAGEVFTFDNLKVHSVENNGESERITLIISMATK